MCFSGETLPAAAGCGSNQPAKTKRRFPAVLGVNAQFPTANSQMIVPWSWELTAARADPSKRASFCETTAFENVQGYSPSPYFFISRHIVVRLT
jgi:hypothetical protein